jgi:predicted RNA binding protein YcfA (HicA-like mRNA interferase family)
MKRREIERALRGAGCRPLRNRGGHEVWGCPCGQHTAPLPNHREITAGVVDSIQKMMPCLGEGWLQ